MSGRRRRWWRQEEGEEENIYTPLIKTAQFAGGGRDSGMLASSSLQPTSVGAPFICGRAADRKCTKGMPYFFLPSSSSRDKGNAHSGDNASLLPNRLVVSPT